MFEGHISIEKTSTFDLGWLAIIVTNHCWGNCIALYRARTPDQWPKQHPWTVGTVRCSAQSLAICWEGWPHHMKRWFPIKRSSVGDLGYPDLGNNIQQNPIKPIEHVHCWHFHKWGAGFLTCPIFVQDINHDWLRHIKTIATVWVDVCHLNYA